MTKFIVGPVLASLKGETRLHTQMPVVTDVIETPKELIAAQEEVKLCIETLFINHLPILATIYRNIKYQSCFSYVQAHTNPKPKNSQQAPFIAFTYDQSTTNVSL